MRKGRLRYYGHVMRGGQEYVGRQGDGNEFTRKEEKTEAKEKISGCSEGGYGKVGGREKDIENKML